MDVAFTCPGNMVRGNEENEDLPGLLAWAWWMKAAVAAASRREAASEGFILGQSGSFSSSPCHRAAIPELSHTFIQPDQEWEDGGRVLQKSNQLFVSEKC